MDASPHRAHEHLPPGAAIAPTSPSLSQPGHAGLTAEAAQITADLLAPDARIAPKYFYDELGCRLFEAITTLPEYYPTRVEQQLYRDHGGEIATLIGPGSTFIDLGAGDCAKAAQLIPALAPRQYVAVDIAEAHVRAAVDALAHRFPGTDMLAVGQDFSRGLHLPESVRTQQRMFFYPGSSIGNFQPHEALTLLGDVRRQCDAQGGLLLGVDLVKDRVVLEAAYNDALGVTASFNLNLLNNVNHLIGSDFRIADWQHHAFFHARHARIEMHLEARQAVSVHWPGGMRSFQAGERIHTENSHKYTPDGVRQLLTQAGFGDIRIWTDPRGWFAICLAHATAHGVRQ